jgi:hypothetical protein
MSFTVKIRIVQEFTSVQFHIRKVSLNNLTAPKSLFKQIVMNSLWQSLLNLLRPRPEVALPQDSSIYKIETSNGKYCGRIIYQDDVTLRLACSKSKPVKILKINILKISQVKSEVVSQYQAWFDTQRSGLSRSY